jgi:hypothetical protein
VYHGLLFAEPTGLEPGVEVLAAGSMSNGVSILQQIPSRMLEVTEKDSIDVRFSIWQV